MESSDGIGDDVLTPNPEFPDQEFTPSQHEGDEVTSGDIIGTPSTTTVTYQQRADDLSDTIRNFRIAHAGDGLLRGNFGNIPDNFEDINEQVSHLQRATDQFTLEGDDLNVSGSFDKGYTVERQDPCPPPQESTNG